MERIENIKGHSISEWEKAFANRTEIHIETMKLHKGLVCGAIGTVRIAGKNHPAKWLHDGRGFSRGKRLEGFDIVLPQSIVI